MRRLLVLRQFEKGGLRKRQAATTERVMSNGPRIPSLNQALAVFSLACVMAIHFGPEQARAEEFSSQQIEFFEKKVRPLLAKHCWKCHGPEKQEANLRLDSRSAILHGGDTGPAVVPGQTESGELLDAISYDPDGYQMPPAGKLSDKEIAILTQWVKMKAPWPPEQANNTTDTKRSWVELFEERKQHWSFRPLTRPSTPNVQQPEWCRGAIDRFLLNKLDEVGLTPNPPADRRTWIRRVTFDVIGLPPTSREIEQFLADDSPNACERVIDRLLASPHFGERWGRHWLDLVRYAESRGHEFDFNVANAWHYRDYVIRAFNQDLPFDQFVVEHIAGDLLTDGSPSRQAPSGQTPRTYSLRRHPLTGANESILGTGFWFFGEWVHSPVDIRQEEADRFENMIDVYSKTFLALTVACARCHDHKFDPISQKDFYALQGYLQSTSYRQVRFETIEQNRQVAQQLEELHRQASPVLIAAYRRAAEPVTRRLEDYLRAARELIPARDESAPRSEPVVIADFESGSYDGWELTGDAFGDRPQTLQTIPDYQGKINAVGKFFVNSHQRRNGGRGDDHVGTMTSPKFTINRRFLTMWVGGGDHVGKTCVDLIVDGKTVRSATGKKSNQMSLVVWNLSQFQGKTARIRIIDLERGGWGNIGVDQIQLTDQPPTDTTDAPPWFSPSFRARIERRAQRDSLDPIVLRNWIGYLLTHHEDPCAPFELWAAYCLGEFPMLADLNRHMDRRRQQLRGRFSPLPAWQEKQSQDAPESRPVSQSFFASQCLPAHPGFSIISKEQWPNGHALLSGEVGAPVAEIFVPDHPFPAIARWDAEWSHLQQSPETENEPGRTADWKRGGRILRTPTFEIDRGTIWALVKGPVRTYVAVDSHILIQGPLHGSLLQTHPEENQWHWIAHNVGRYRGHRAHVEFVPVDGKPFALAWVGLSDDRPREANWRPWSGPVDSEQELLRWSAQFDDQWMIDHPDLFALNSPTNIKRFAALARPFIERREQLIRQIRSVSALAPAMLDGSAEGEYVFIRGAWKKHGPPAGRQYLALFSGKPPSPESFGSGRLELAMQMVDPQQTPILARVIVNRIWQHYFGRGIVPTPDDFGFLGQPPSHPELLDWLASELIRHDWSLKWIHRQILNSAAYRMSSDMAFDDQRSLDERERIQTIDPQNRLWHRMNVKRLEGEVIRDAILSLSGRFDPRMHGKSIPVHLTPFMTGRGRPSVSGPVDGNGRRSLYLAVRRNFPDPFFQAFDFPNPHTTIGRRNVSNVPAQALVLMNNPFVTEQVDLWAKRLLRERSSSSNAARIEHLYLITFGRPPTAGEFRRGERFLARYAQELGVAASDSAVWAAYVHVLINTKEFLFIR